MRNFLVILALGLLLSGNAFSKTNCSKTRENMGLTTINTFDLVDSGGNRVTEVGSSSESTLYLVENGDVSLDGAFVAIT